MVFPDRLDLFARLTSIPPYPARVYPGSYALHVDLNVDPSSVPYALLLQLLAQLRKLVMIGFSIPIVRKLRITLVRGDHPSGMLDGAPILLGPGGDLTHIGEESIRVRAVQAVDPFDSIQIGELVSIEDQIVASAYPADAIDRETYDLI